MSPIILAYLNLLFPKLTAPDVVADLSIAVLVVPQRLGILFNPSIHHTEWRAGRCRQQTTGSCRWSCCGCCSCCCCCGGGGTADWGQERKRAAGRVVAAGFLTKRGSISVGKGNRISTTPDVSVAVLLSFAQVYQPNCNRIKCNETTLHSLYCNPMNSNLTLHH